MGDSGRAHLVSAKILADGARGGEGVGKQARRLSSEGGGGSWLGQPSQGAGGGGGR